MILYSWNVRIYCECVGVTYERCFMNMLLTLAITISPSDTEDSNYHLDVLSVLQELQREGLVRSLATKNFPPDLLRKAIACGFDIDSNQILCNLLDPTRYTKELQLACQDLNLQLLLENPLAGDLLTNKFSNTEYEPPPWELASEQRNDLDTYVTPWARKHSSNDKRWKTYQTELLDTLGDVALKHRISVTSVSLRWAMQLPHVASVIVPCETREENDDRAFDMPEKLREVFRFDLDKEDMERLWEASGEASLVKEPEFEPLVGLENLDLEGVEDDGFFVPDFSNNKLWL